MTSIQTSAACLLPGVVANFRAHFACCRRTSRTSSISILANSGMIGINLHITVAVKSIFCSVWKLMKRTILSVRLAMGAKKWSMTDLAAASGIDPSAISKLFAGRFPSAIIAKKLLTAFPDGEKLEIAGAWLNDTAELIGIDPTRLTIGVGNTAGLGDDRSGGTSCKGSWQICRTPMVEKLPEAATHRILPTKDSRASEGIRKAQKAMGEPDRCGAKQTRSQR